MGEQRYHQLRALLEMQKVDTDIQRLKADMERQVAEGGVEELRREIGRGKERLRDLGTRLSGLRKDLRWREKEEEDLVANVQTMEAKLYGGQVKSSRELEGIQKKVAALRAKQSELEEGAIRDMEMIEELEGEVAREERELFQREEALRCAVAKVEEAVRTLESRLQVLTCRKQEILSGIDRGLLDQYEYLRQRNAGLAVVQMSGDTCSGCRVRISTMMAGQVKKGQGVHKCENCGRILVWVS